MTLILFIELLLIFVTTLVLTQFVGGGALKKARVLGGVFLLMATFCWSVILGVMVGLGHLPEVL